MDNNYCVYMHKCIKNNKIYIGMTNDVKRRWRSKGVEYKPPKNEDQNSRSFWNAIKKYGWDNFQHLIIENNLTEKEAEEKEKYYILKYNTGNKKYGYNIAPGGNGGKVYLEHPRGMLGKHHSIKKKIQQSKLMKKLNEEGKCGTVWKHGHPRGMLGKHQSEEYKERLRNIPSDKHPSHISVRVIFPDGKFKDFGCTKYAKEFLKLDGRTVARLRRTGQEYELPKGNMKKEYFEWRKSLVGIRIVEITENTEITKGSKNPLVS